MYDNEKKLMTKIALLFYEGGYTQEEIGRMLGMSRLQVHRRLRTAVETKVVRVKIESEFREGIVLENRLKDLYRLGEILIVENAGDPEKTKEHIARGAADLLMTKLEDFHFLGVSWGSTVRMVPDFLPKKDFRGVKVGNIVGGLSELGDLGAQQVAVKIATKLNADTKLLSLPFMLQSAAAKSAIFSDEYVKQDIQALKKCDICLVGIGYVGQDFLKGVYNEESRGAGSESVGEIVGRYFDLDGNVVKINPSEDRIIGLTLDDLKKVPISIGAAGGIEKSRAITGALRGGYINCLVTDQKTAEAIIDLEESTAEPRKKQKPAKEKN